MTSIAETPTSPAADAAPETPAPSVVQVWHTFREARVWCLHVDGGIA